MAGIDWGGIERVFEVELRTQIYLAANPNETNG
jgi:hypothetical protein